MTRRSPIWPHPVVDWPYPPEEEPKRKFMVEFFAYETVGMAMPNYTRCDVWEVTLDDGTVIQCNHDVWLELFTEECEYCGRAPCRCLDH